MITTFAIESRAGGSLTGLTVKTNVVLAEPLLASVTVIVIAAAPNWLPTGVSATVRLLALPPKIMFALGTSAGLEELPATARLLAGVSRSATVKAMAGLAVSSLID